MKQQRLGNTGLDVSDVGLGTFEWGHRVDVPVAQRLVDDYVAAGGNLIELPTSGVHAAGVLSQLTLPEQIMLVARVGVSMSESSHIEVGLGRARILSQVDALLSATGRSHIDVLILDVFDPEVDRAETASAIDTLLTLGKIRYVGVSHHAGWELAEMRGAGVPIACAIAEYSLLNREAEDDLLPAANYAGVGLIAGAGLGRGVLSDKYRSGTPQDSRFAAGELSDYVGAYLDERSTRVLAGVRKAAAALGVTAADIALAFNRYQGVASSLVSARTPEQLAQVLGSDVDLEPEIAEVLDQIS
ncbi:Predicted oxidoreductase [Brevibacterium sandarakinum]|uniref:Predicted oxidoreductase n=1 Tax=Brevibacterium sandarakinum TaxID=629680 RepID=A0A1H1Y163_BRESA|nr:aldo/keto reductase [Brevibacterium sandarakinum]SDT15173.1 Predicted oxidoreductase [Brevibacterium sandarakinum]